MQTFVRLATNKLQRLSPLADIFHIIAWLAYIDIWLRKIAHSKKTDLGMLNSFFPNSNLVCKIRILFELRLGLW